jgi:hypothetical protein
MIEKDTPIEVNVAKLRELKVAVDTFTKTRGINALTDVANKLANIYSDMLGSDCVLKISRRKNEGI